MRKITVAPSVADHRCAAAREGAEQHAPGQGHEQRSGHRQGDNRHVGQHEQRHGGEAVVRHKGIENGAVAHQIFQRQLPVPPHRQNQYGGRHDHNQRRKTAQFGAIRPRFGMAVVAVHGGHAHSGADDPGRYRPLTPDRLGPIYTPEPVPRAHVTDI
jgi:hypothetical protein